MVTNLKAAALFAKESSQPVLEQLDPPRRAAVLMALLGLVILGLVLVTCAMIGARWVRRAARHKPGVFRAQPMHEAARNERLRGALASVLPEPKTNDTLNLGRAPSDTKLDL